MRVSLGQSSDPLGQQQTKRSDSSDLLKTRMEVLNIFTSTGDGQIINLHQCLHQKEQHVVSRRLVRATHPLTPQHHLVFTQSTNLGRKHHKPYCPPYCMSQSTTRAWVPSQGLSFLTWVVSSEDHHPAALTKTVPTHKVGGDRTLQPQGGNI